MAFRSANMLAHSIRFNSALSSDFLESYNDMLNKDLTADKGPTHRTFAPSQMRCDRISWFRLRGTEPDKDKLPDKTLSFTAQVGTSCHEAIQERLSRNMKGDWVSVQEWVDSNPEFFQDYDMSIERNGYESLINLIKPFPVRFACDGIIKFQNKIILLEIKTSEFSSWNDLTEPKPQHLTQAKCYATLLNIPIVLFFYQDRQYGDIKCFEVEVTYKEQQEIRDRMLNVMRLAEANIAPEGLPYGDSWCTPSMCAYYNKCKQWGR